MIKIVRGGRGGGWGGGSSERCLKWGGGGGESLSDLSKNILKQGVGKGKRGEGVSKVSPPLPPPRRKILIIHLGAVIFPAGPG